MISGDHIRNLLAEHKPGFSLPQAFYGDPGVFAADLEAIFKTQWLFACNVCELADIGDHLTFDIGRTSVLLVRSADAVVRGFYNTCRHRGSRLCLSETGNAARITCPYHHWTYDLDGTLLHATSMGDDFDKSAYGLKPVHVEIICGLVYVCLAESPPDIAPIRAAMSRFIAPHRPERTKVAAVSNIVEKCNWKLVIENNRECYHCEGNHPELLVSLVDFPIGDIHGVDDDRLTLLRDSHARWSRLGFACEVEAVGRQFRCIRLPFHRGIRSMTLDGELGCKKLLGDLVEPDLGSVRMFTAPNNWHHFLADHIIHFRVTPLGPEETLVRTTWLVHEDAIEGWDYDPARLREVWDQTNLQDKDLAENNQRGIASPAYEPGPYAPTIEAGVINFVEWYAETLHNKLDPPLRLAAE